MTAQREVELRRIGQFGVGPPIDIEGEIVADLYTIYHVPTGMMLVPWACPDLRHMLAEAQALRNVQHHARVWRGSDVKKLCRDRRAQAEVARLLERLSFCSQCRPLEIEAP